MNTRTLADILGIRYPIIQGGMANIADGAFAASIANAGGMGIIATGGMTPERLREEIRKCRTLTNGKFGVNLMLMLPNADEMAQIIAEEEVCFVTTGAGNPGKYMPLWKEKNIIVAPVVSSAALARRMEREGASMVIAEGTESGGHVGEMTTMTLVPQVVSAVSIPVVAAGGIADGRQLAAAFALGAIGAQIGTAFLVSKECPIHENYKNALIKSRDNGTTVTGRISGTPVRILKNAMAREYIKKEKAGAGVDELEHFTLGSLRRAVFDGDVVNGSLMAGQASAQLNEILPASQIMENICRECCDVMNSFAGIKEGIAAKEQGAVCDEKKVVTGIKNGAKAPEGGIS